MTAPPRHLCSVTLWQGAMFFWSTRNLLGSSFYTLTKLYHHSMLGTDYVVFGHYKLQCKPTKHLGYASFKCNESSENERKIINKLQVISLSATDVSSMYTIIVYPTPLVYNVLLISLIFFYFLHFRNLFYNKLPCKCKIKCTPQHFVFLGITTKCN